MNSKKIPCTFQSLAFGGGAFGTVTEQDSPHAGRAVIVPFVAPGEEAVVSFSEKDLEAGESKSLMRGELVQILRPSTERISPLCPVFGECGGCDYQYLSIKSERAEKVEFVRSLLERKGKITPENGVTLAGEALPEYHYRRRVSLRYDEKVGIGFYRPKTRQVVAVQGCPLVISELDRVIALLSSLHGSYPFPTARITLEKGEVLAVRFEVPGRTLRMKEDFREFFDRAYDELQQSATGEVLLELQNESGVLYERASNSGTLSKPLGAFGQVNEAGNEVLQNLVFEHLKGVERLTDLYGGSGNLSLRLAETGVPVTCVESSRALIEYGRSLTRERGLSMKFVKESCESYVKRKPPSGAILLDPPRSGAKGVVESFAPERVPKIVYVSCHTPTLMRDLMYLVSVGYVVREVRVVDMFPRTHHVETVTVLDGG